MRNTAYLGLGSNMGDRFGILRAAVERLNAEQSITVKRVSPVYETAPISSIDQPDFYNAAAEIVTGLKPEALLDVCMSIEHDMGRVRTVKWGPRTLDIDILLYGGRIIDEPELKIPHPLMNERAFVLYPLADIAFDIIHPVIGKTVGALRDEIPDEGITVVPGLTLM